MLPLATNQDLYVFLPWNGGAGQSHRFVLRKLFQDNLGHFDLCSDCTGADVYHNTSHTGTTWESNLFGWLPSRKDAFQYDKLPPPIHMKCISRFCSPPGRDCQIVFQEHWQFWVLQSRTSCHLSLYHGDKRLAEGRQRSNSYNCTVKYDQHEVRFYREDKLLQ